MAARLTSIHPVLMTRDVAASLRFFEGFGFTVAFQDAEESPMYAGIRRDAVELHLQWHDAAEWQCPQKHDRPNYRFLVEDIDELFAELHARGALPEGTKVADTPWGTREFHVYDPDQNGLQFYCDL